MKLLKFILLLIIELFANSRKIHQSEIYFLRSKQTGKCINNNGQGKTVNLQKCDEKAATQKWRIRHNNDGTYSIFSIVNDLVLGLTKTENFINWALKTNINIDGLNQRFEIQRSSDCKNYILKIYKSMCIVFQNNILDHYLHVNECDKADLYSFQINLNVDAFPIDSSNCHSTSRPDNIPATLSQAEQNHTPINNRIDSSDLSDDSSSGISSLDSSPDSSSDESNNPESESESDFPDSDETNPNDQATQPDPQPDTQPDPKSDTQPDLKPDKPIGDKFINEAKNNLLGFAKNKLVSLAHKKIKSLFRNSKQAAKRKGSNPKNKRRKTKANYLYSKHKNSPYRSTLKPKKNINYGRRINH